MLFDFYIPNKFGIKEKEDWYQVTPEKLKGHGLDGLLDKYSGSVRKALGERIIARALTRDRCSGKWAGTGPLRGTEGSRCLHLRLPRPQKRRSRTCLAHRVERRRCRACYYETSLSMSIAISEIIPTVLRRRTPLGPSRGTRSQCNS